ncbi:50S ribosomal protein L5 [candidate division WWE3 bacterium]|nr:50S ribosomal protein L5 [candidate division WWE3 bacterium]
MKSVQQKYTEEVVPYWVARSDYRGKMAIPALKKVVINMGLGAAKGNAKEVESAVEELRAITGQAPVVTKARKSIAAFSLREGMDVGAKVTLRGKKMYHFLDKVFNFVLPRGRDFQGLSLKGFDGNGNYSFGFEEQMTFLEINPNKVTRSRGLQITLVTSATNDEQARQLLTMLGTPFEKEQNA